MKNPVSTSGYDRLRASLQLRLEKARKDQGLSVEVGYSAPHAVYVHEDLQAEHPNGGQAKYLEAPSRLHKVEIQRAVSETYARTGDLETSLVAGGELLLELSKPLVPVDTGELLESGFVAVVRDKVTGD